MEPHTIHLGLGSNLGDRQATLAHALGRLRQAFLVQAVSSAYETEPVGNPDQPPYINLVIRATTDREPAEVLALLLGLEAELGRSRVDGQRNAPRPLDIDLLFYDDLTLESPGLTLPHPRAHERAFVLVPLAEISPGLSHPILKRTAAELASDVTRAGVRRLDRGLLAGFTRDVQDEAPSHAIGLERVGITGLRRVIHLESHHPVTVFYATMDLYVDLPARRKGAHMSRFPHVVEETLDDVVRRKAPDIESLAGRVAEGLLAAHGAGRAECRVQARVPHSRFAPLSGVRTQEVFLLHGWAAATPQATARLVGVEADGMTACPCAQDLLRDHARSRLLDAGFSRGDADRALDIVPMATHSQRGTGRLLVSAHPTVSADDLLRIVEGSMSSEVYSLLKRVDEFFVVNRAHRNPKFVEDVVRDMLGFVVANYPELPDDAYAYAHQVNHESIHPHDVVAERGATLGQLRRELEGGPGAGSLDVEAWIRRQLGG